jgi:tetratricopeptide (TPR) repeat protein
MKPKISAFVGHSFDDNDEQLIIKFLNYFDSLKSTGDWFDWDHAEKAESKLLSQKVKEKMEGKNLFIGIFTKKKREIDDKKLLKRGILNKGKIITREEDYSWNTSDWIIQESGYALARGMDLIFLVEDELLSVGGLQGDREYIRFYRDNPAGCFQNIMEMIGSLVPRVKILDVEEIADAPKNQEVGKPTEQASDKQEEKPQADWSKNDYEGALFRAIFINDEKEEIEISERYLATIDKENINEIVSWKAEHLFYKSVHRPSDELEQMKALARDNPNHPVVRWYLGQMNMNFKNFDQAAVEFMRSAENRDGQGSKVKSLCKAAEAKAEAGKFTEAVDIIGSIVIKGMADDNADLFKVFHALSLIALGQKDFEKNVAFCEAALLIKPDDHQMRFSLAYKYSELEKNQLALYQYKILTENVPDETNWNNIGVAYDSLELSAKSVSAYKKSEELSGTLAMSNLAKKLISAGFLDEAQQICNKATKIQDYDKRVGEAISKIGDVRKEESLKEEKELESIHGRRRFSIEFAMAYRPGESIELSPKWKSPLCALDITVQNGKFFAKGEYQRSKTSLGLLAALTKPAIPSEPTYSKVVVVYNGSIIGRAIEYDLLITRESSNAEIAPTLTLKHGLMSILKDKTEILVLEKDKEDKEELYSLKLLNQ